MRSFNTSLHHFPVRIYIHIYMQIQPVRMKALWSRLSLLCGLVHRMHYASFNDNTIFSQSMLSAWYQEPVSIILRISILYET